MCILCRKKQELLIKTGTWMQGTSDFSTDPILRRIEQDMAPNSGTSSPQRDAPSPAPSSTISSLFSRAMSFGAGTPTGTPKTIVPSSTGGRPFYRQSSLFDKQGAVLGRPYSNVLSPRTETGPRYTSHNLPRQRSLESSEYSVSPSGGTGYLIGTGPSRYTRGSLVRRRSEGGEDAGSYLSDIGESNFGLYPEATTSSTLRTTMLGGIQVPTIGSQGPQSQRFRPPFNRGTGIYPPPRGAVRGMRSRPPFLSRGRSMDTPYSSHLSPSLLTNPSVHQLSVTTQPHTSMSYTNIESGGIGGIVGSQVHSSRMQTDYMSAPEGGGWASGYESSGGLDRDTTIKNLYPRVHITDSGPFGRNDQQKEPFSSFDDHPVLSSTSVPNTFSTMSYTATNTAQPGVVRSSLLDPRSAAHSAAPSSGLTMSGTLGTNVTPGSSAGGVTRRKLDSTFRTDSLSSDQSETRVRPPPPKPHKPKRNHRQSAHPSRAQTTDGNAASNVNFGALGSSSVDPSKPLSGSGRSRASGSSGRGKAFGASSSEDEIRSTDFTSCGEEEMESESVSEKGKLCHAFWIHVMVKVPTFHPKLLSVGWLI